MNIHDLMKKATPAPLSAKEGTIRGEIQHICIVYDPSGKNKTRDEATAALLAHGYNMCPKLLAALIESVGMRKASWDIQQTMMGLPKGEYPDALTKFDALIAEASEVKE